MLTYYELPLPVSAWYVHGRILACSVYLTAHACLSIAEQMQGVSNFNANASLVVTDLVGGSTLRSS